MLRKTASGKSGSAINYIVISGLGLAFCLFASTGSAQQNQPSQVSAAPMQQDQQDPQAQGAPDPGMQQGPPERGMQQGPPQRGMQGPPDQALPESLTLPVGTVIRVRVNEWLSSDRNLPGDTFSAVLDQPIVVDGWVVGRRGQSETGRVSMAKKAGRVTGTSQLGVELSEVTLVDGQQLPIQTELLKSSAGTSHGQDAATIGTTTGVGAAIGAVADGGRGAGIGAGAGAAAGIIGVLATRGKPTVIFPETVLTFRLQAPVTISTEKSQYAFQTVTQQDYDSRSPNGRPQHFGTPGPDGYPAPPPYYYGYPYAYGYPYPYGYYPGPFAFGFYGGYGFGPRFGGFRGGRGFRR